MHRPTALAGSGPFELYEHMWRTCLDSAVDRADIRGRSGKIARPLRSRIAYYYNAGASRHHQRVSI